MKTNLIVKLDDLDIVRIRCDSCKAVLEVAISELTSSVKPRCGNCEKSFKIGKVDPLVEFGKAIQQIKDYGGGFSIEFPILVDDESSSSK